MRTPFKKSFIFFFLFFFVLTLFFVHKTNAQTNNSQDQRLKELQEQIKKYEEELSKLRSQSATLSNQIAVYDAQIKLASLQIEETQREIELLDGRIDQLETSLDALTRAFSSRAAETYKMAKLGDPVLFIISSPSLSTAFSRFQYLKLIQRYDQDLMVKLQATQTTYQDEKKDKQDLQKQLEKQKANLDAQKAAKANLLAATKNDERYYQRLLDQARSQLAALRRFVTSQGGATILQNQTKCDSWGCYYNQRDSQWGTIGIGGSSYSVAEYGCLISSIAMIATHYGKKMTPADIAVNSNYFVPGTGYIYHQAEGMPFVISTASWSQLDSLLAKGPVIAGLYSGPDHFIVILKKEGNDYIMHDPFMPDGANRRLSEKYSVSNITSLRLVSFK
jgi:peptidoglycan hydrolase CwlO-like protein